MADIKKQKEATLRKELDKKRKELREFRFAMAGTKTRNVKEGRDLKKNIARLLTELNRRASETK